MLANLKTLTETKLLYNVFTPDATISLLASIHTDSRTVMAMMSEIDPLKQRIQPEIVFLKKVVPVQVVDDFAEDDDSDDDGDIFAEPKPKKNELMFKKKTSVAVEEVKAVPSPLKAAIVIKMIQFDDQSQCSELWKVELPLDFKKKMLKCKASEEFFAFMVQESAQGFT